MYFRKNAGKNQERVEIKKTLRADLKLEGCKLINGISKQAFSFRKTGTNREKQQIGILRV